MRAPTLKMKMPPVPESLIQNQIVQGLTLMGYIVLVIGSGRKRVRCPGCGSWHWPAGWQGNTPGCPDLIVSRFDWPAGVWLGLEVKGAKTAIRAEQKELAEMGRVQIVRSLEDALRIVQAGNEQLRALLTTT